MNKKELGVIAFALALVAFLSGLRYIIIDETTMVIIAFVFAVLVVLAIFRGSEDEE